MKLFLSTLAFAIVLASQFACAQGFEDQQRRYPRVREAIREKDALLSKLFESKDIEYPPRQILIRIFKKEKILQLWSASIDNFPFRLIKEYPICVTSGNLGPKKQRGDRQIPEGFYFIDRFNPSSNFHLSLGINYPNRSDKILGVSGNLGGDIFIHGGCVTIGCIPITDDYIKELYWVAVQAKAKGQSKIPVHIFPTKLGDENMDRLRKTFPDSGKLIAFWQNLKMVYDRFEQTQKLPTIRVNEQGTYLFSR